MEYDKETIKSFLENAAKLFTPQEITQMMGLEALVEKSRLSKPAIIKHISKGNIILDPFNEKSIGSAQIDVKLGPHIYRERFVRNTPETMTIYNPFDERQVKKLWIAQKSIPAEQIAREYGKVSTEQYFGENIFPKDEIILIQPGETILGHTLEFLGGRNNITTEMKARSSTGRNFIGVCKCAGLGDIGYVNRWTMEITNFSRYYTIPLVVGRRIAQITFYQTEPVSKETDYSTGGKYQTSANIEELKKNWKPEDMLPKMWKDREVTETIKS